MIIIGDFGGLGLIGTGVLAVVLWAALIIIMGVTLFIIIGLIWGGIATLVDKIKGHS